MLFLSCVAIIDWHCFVVTDNACAHYSYLSLTHKFHLIALRFIKQNMIKDSLVHEATLQCVIPKKSLLYTILPGIARNIFYDSNS